MREKYEKFLHFCSILDWGDAAIMEIISVDFYRIYRVSLSGKAFVLLFCASTHDEKQYGPSPSPSTMLLTTLITGPQFNIVWGGEGQNFEKVSKVYKLISKIVDSRSTFLMAFQMTNSQSHWLSKNRRSYLKYFGLFEGICIVSLIAFACNTTIQSLACATCACAQATITLGCLWKKGIKQLNVLHFYINYRISKL